jgi:hypothetical protein
MTVKEFTQQVRKIDLVLGSGEQTELFYEFGFDMLQLADDDSWEESQASVPEPIVTKWERKYAAAGVSAAWQW